ncbi:MAG: type II secretion system F family protein [Planctomycetaceae bacterium]|nr:type II secretion system F family protein [Planctomycetaceae bacterium]
MPTFRYKARQLNGQSTTGTLTANSEHDATVALAARSLFPIELESEPVKAHRRRRVSARVLSAVYRQLADLLRAGVPLARCLEILAQQDSHPELRRVMPQLLTAVRDGSSLADAMAQHPTVFRELVVSIIRAGEEGGFLEDALQRVAGFVEQQDELASRIQGAVAYPGFLVVTGVIVVLGMLVFFVPNFAPIFDRLAQEGKLPWLTQALIAASDALRGQAWGLAALLIAAVAGVVYLIRQPATVAWCDRYRLRLYGIGPVIRDLAVARFCRVLGTLLRNGVPILNSLKIAKDATGVTEITEAIAAATQRISAGRSLAKPLSECRHFQPDVLEMIAVGEQSNRLEHVLVDLADAIDRRTQRRIDLLVRLIEPSLLLVIAMIVLLMVIGLLLPAFDSAGTIS